jgi:hypothetical protein
MKVRKQPDNKEKSMALAASESHSQLSPLRDTGDRDSRLRAVKEKRLTVERLSY